MIRHNLVHTSGNKIFISLIYMALESPASTSAHPILNCEQSEPPVPVTFIVFILLGGEISGWGNVMDSIIDSRHSQTLKIMLLNFPHFHLNLQTMPYLTEQFKNIYIFFIAESHENIIFKHFHNDFDKYGP